MEIVRQRKKRLLAWILTLVLCVGMWQGSVYAEEPIEGNTEVGEEDVNPNTLIEDNPVVNEPTYVYINTIEIETVNSALNSVPGGSEHNLNNILGDTSINGEWEVQDAGVKYRNYSGSALNLQNIYFSSAADFGKYKHNVLKWYYNVKGEEADTKVEISTDNPQLSNMSFYARNEIKGETESSVTVENVYKLTAVLGKSVIVTFWEEAYSGEGADVTVYTQEIDSNNILGDNVESKSIAQESDNRFSVILPGGSQSDRGFITGWKRLTNDGGEEGTFTVAKTVYEKEYADLDFEEEMRFKAEYSFNVPEEGGEFYLFTEEDYYLNANKYTVSKDGKSDGYSYDVNPNTAFYVGDEGKYTFTKMQ